MLRSPKAPFPIKLVWSQRIFVSFANATVSSAQWRLTSLICRCKSAHDITEMRRWDPTNDKDFGRTSMIMFWTKVKKIKMCIFSATTVWMIEHSLDLYPICTYYILVHVHTYILCHCVAQLLTVQPWWNQTWLTLELNTEYVCVCFTHTSISLSM